MMGDCVTPRHSAVMERLRRRIELFRQHHNGCESRYERASLERLELDRQQTYALHQRCLQAKAKRSSKQRQSQPTAGEAPGGRGPEGAEGAEQSRNTTLAALQETVKRKIERAGSPLGRDQVNSFGDGFPPNKKQCLDNGATNRSPLDSKLGLTDPSANGKHESSEDTTDFHLKELKQEPDDILPIMPPSGGGSNAGSLFPDLNLNEQEWSELMEELNCTVAYEDIQDILNDDDPLELTPAPAPEPQGGGIGGGAQAASGGTQPGGTSGGGAGRPAAPGLLPPDLSTVKAEFSPASLDSHSPLVNVRSSVNPSTSSSSLPSAAPSVAPPSSTSPALHPQPQSARPLQNHMLPSKDLSPAQQLQQLAAQQRQQHLHGALQHKPNQPGTKFHPQAPHPHPHPQAPHSHSQAPHSHPQAPHSHPQAPHSHPQAPHSHPQAPHSHPQAPHSHPQAPHSHPQAPHSHPQAPHSHPQAWAQMGGASQSPIPGGFNMEKPSSPSLYQQDMMFNPSQNQLLLPSQAGKGSPKAGTFLQGGPSGMSHSLGHPSAPPPPQQQQQQQPPPGAQLNFNNTKPLSHYEARGPGSDQSKNQLMTLLRHQQQQQQQQQQHLKQKTMGYRPHLQHPQDQNSFGASALQQQQPGPGAPGMGANPAMANHSNHANPAVAAMGGSAAYMNSQQVAAALKQQQQRQQQQQQQQQYLQRQQMIEQEKQRQQQDQQLKRHLSRPPPQYQDQTGPPPNQTAFSQQQFTGSSASMGGVTSMGPANPASRMFPPPQGMMGMGGNAVAPPTNPQAPPQPPQTQADILTAANGLYNNASINQQRQQQLYRQNMLMKQTQNNAAILKQQQQQQQQQQQLGVRLPGQMNSNLQVPQNVTWSQQMANSQLATQQIANHGNQLANQQMHGGFSNAAQNAFHLQQQQQRLPKMQQFTPAGRPLNNAMNAGQQMMQQRGNPNATSLAQQQGAPQPDLSAFGQQASAARNGLQCNYGVGRAAAAASAQAQQQLSCGYNVAAGSFAEESELVDSLLKGQSTQEWMDDLDELLAGHH